MYVCLCKGVTQKQIRREVLDGVATYQELQDRLEVGLCCGTCKDSAEEVIFEALGESLARDNNVIEMWIPVRRAM
jgi:bacterioferritin-associated ferredoxin